MGKRAFQDTGSQRSNGREALLGRLLLDLDISPADRPAVLTARLSLSLIRTGGKGSVELLSNRPFQVNLGTSQSLRFRLSVPPGDYEALRLRWGHLKFEGRRKTPSPDAGEHVFPISISNKPRATARIELRLNAKALLGGQALAKALQVSAAPVEKRAESRPKAGEAVVLRWHPEEPGIEAAEMPSLRIPANAIPPGTRVVIRETPGDGLPELFKRQRRVGPVIAVEAEAAPGNAVEVTVPYDQSLVARVGVQANELIVMRLDAARSRYHELRPTRVDTRNRTLTVRTRELSDFFACTPGILIRIPELFPTRWNIIGVVTGTATTIAGRIEDERAAVSLIRPQAPPGWSQFRWFEFQDVPLEGPSTLVEIEALVEGEVPHTCQFTLRAEQPPKRVDLTNRLYGPALDVSADDRPVISAVLNHWRLTDTGLRPPGEEAIFVLSRWQRDYLRPEPFVYQQGRGGSFWHRTALLPETYFENECARQAVEAARLVPNNAAPEAERYLISIDDFLQGLSMDDPRRTELRMLLDRAANEFREQRLILSPVAPVLAEGGDDFSVAFVAASLPGRRVAEANGMQPLFRRLHAHPRGEWNERPVVYAGRLFFTQRVGGVLRRELVAEDVWCATVAMKRDPHSGQPLIAALGLAADADGQPRSALRLYRRQRDGSWAAETIIEDRPIVDFDFAFAPDGSLRFVAVLPAEDELLKWRMITIRRLRRRWLAEPLFYLLPGEDRAYDLGACPRLHVDEKGRSVVAFIVFLTVLSWAVAVEGPPWRAAWIQQARHIDLVGSPFQSEAIVPLDAPVLTSGLSLVHWRPAIVSDGEGGLWCAYGSGMLNLARIDPDLLLPQFVPLEVARIDVDRMTGFYPALALRQNRAPAVVFKDPFGFGQFGPGDQDEVHFLSIDDGNLTPLNEAFAPVLPPSVRGLIGVLRDFRPGQGFPPPESMLDIPPYVPLDCANVMDAGQFDQLLFSALAYRKFRMEVYPSGGDYPHHKLNYTLSHPRLAAMIEGLAKRPTMSIFVIDNSDSQEQIERVDITQFTDPVGAINTSFAADLDQRNVTDEIRMAFRNQDLALSDRPIVVTVLDAGNAWDLVDGAAFALSGMPLAQTYLVRRRERADGGGPQLAIRIPPVVSVVDRADTRGTDGRRTPCGLPQELWDLATPQLADRFTGFPIDLPDDIPGQIRRIEISDMRMTGYEAWDPPNEQQGAVRFTFTIPRVTFRNAGPDVTGWTTDPSFLRITVAPHTSEGNIQWWVRELEIAVSRFEVDVDVGVFSWLKWFAVIPGLGFLFLVVDPFLDSWARSAVNKDFEPPGSGGIEDMLREAMQQWTERKLGARHAYFEGLYLRNLELRTWVRERLPVARGSDLSILPRGVNFGQHEAGSPLVRRNVLLANNGNVPALIQDVSLARGRPDMAIESLRQWPANIAPGDSLVIGLSYAPQGDPGFREGELQVRSNGGRVDAIPLFANVLAPPGLPYSPLRIRPRSIQFGIIQAGQRADREVELYNAGGGIVVITNAGIEGPQAGAFELRNDPTGTLLRGQSVPVRVRFRPSAGISVRYDARVVLETNISGLPEIEIDITGFAIASELLVTPTALRFNDSPIAANLPPLPPGLPPTVRQGSTRSITVGNTGLADLNLTADSFRALDLNGVDSPHYRLWDVQGSALSTAPRTLRSGETFVVVVEFYPQAPGDHSAVINIQRAGAAQPTIPVSISGRALP